MKHLIFILLFFILFCSNDTVNPIDENTQINSYMIEYRVYGTSINADITYKYYGDNKVLNNESLPFVARLLIIDPCLHLYLNARNNDGEGILEISIYINDEEIEYKRIQNSTDNITIFRHVYSERCM